MPSVYVYYVLTIYTVTDYMPLLYRMMITVQWPHHPYKVRVFTAVIHSTWILKLCQVLVCRHIDFIPFIVQNGSEMKISYHDVICNTLYSDFVGGAEISMNTAHAYMN